MAVAYTNVNGTSVPKAYGPITHAAAYAGVKPRAIRGWLKDGLRCYRLNNKTILIRFEDVDQYLDKYATNSASREEQLNAIVNSVCKG